MTGPAKAFLLTERGDRIECLFNPAELTVSKSTSWSAGERKGANAPSLRFQSGQSATLSLSLTLDTTHDGSDVSAHANKLLDLMKTSKLIPGLNFFRNAARPPWVVFQWGKIISFRAVAERVQIRYTYFASSGTPLRAKADLTLKQMKDEYGYPLQNPTSSTPEVHTVHKLAPGETLDRVAAVHYGDATRWRVIADANAVVDPLEVPPGTTLVIPELPVRHRG
jgi:nucleoid-associated protein YgaU